MTTELIGGIVEVSNLITTAYIVLTIIFSLTYRKSIIFDKFSRNMCISKVILFKFTHEYSFDLLEKITLETKQQFIPGGSLIPVENHLLYAILKSGKKILIDKSTDNEYISQCKDSICNICNPTSA